MSETMSAAASAAVAVAAAAAAEATSEVQPMDVDSAVAVDAPPEEAAAAKGGEGATAAAAAAAPPPPPSEGEAERTWGAAPPSAEEEEASEPAAAAAAEEGGGGGSEAEAPGAAGAAASAAAAAGSSDPLASDDLDASSSSDDSTDDDEDDEDDDDDDMPTSPSSDPTSALVDAMSRKEEGNAAFNAGDLVGAARLYRRGASALRPLNRTNAGDEQVRSVLVSLQTNLSTVLFKQGRLKMSRNAASRALGVDGTCVKALYRRAAAHRKLGDDEGARADLREALRLDPDNVAVKRELLSLRKEMEVKRKAEKERLQRAFSSRGRKGSFLYEDKEEEERKKAEAKRAKREAERLARENRKKEWEDECVRRLAADREAISFEDWERERKRREEEEEKARKKARKEEEERRRAERRRAARERAGSAGAGAGAAPAGGKAASSSDDDDLDDVGLTKSELEAMRGYKKTSDGRTTSYFTRELSEEQRAIIGDIAPQRLDASAASASGSAPPSAAGGASAAAAAAAAPVPTPAPGAGAGAGGSATAAPSAWNRAGTWEERDASEWCASCLRRHLSSAYVSLPPPSSDDGGDGAAAAAGGGGGGGASSHYSAEVREVRDLTGDASVAIAGGRKRYIFDYRASVRYDVVLRRCTREGEGGGEDKSPDRQMEEEDEGEESDKPKEVVASGVLNLPDINSGAAHELEVDVPGGWKKVPTADHGEGARECRERMACALREGVMTFVREFNARY